jgi:pyruvate/2-oxoglutarate dehydrogenase complex dihydrolipoamide acyltransferase (E2) component
MTTEVFISKMTDFMEEATILSWLVADGDHVDEGQAILELETDKASAELEAPAGGYLRIRPGTEPGMIIPVGETIAYVTDSPDEEITWP